MTMDFCPITLKSCQSRFTILPKIKQTYKNLPKAYTISPKWGNFAKSGHTGGKEQRRKTTGWTGQKVLATKEEIERGRKNGS